MIETGPPNPMNRRKPENRWRRILRDADRDQEGTVRTWLKFARHFFGDKKDEDDSDDSQPKAA